jgi:hypothetical protein
MAETKLDQRLGGYGAIAAVDDALVRRQSLEPEIAES